jgi:hypothetical protein
MTDILVYFAALVLVGVYLRLRAKRASKPIYRYEYVGGPLNASSVKRVPVADAGRADGTWRH